MVQGNGAASGTGQADFIGGLALALMALAIVVSLLLLAAMTNPG